MTRKAIRVTAYGSLNELNELFSQGYEIESTHGDIFIMKKDETPDVYTYTVPCGTRPPYISTGVSMPNKIY